MSLETEAPDLSSDERRPTPQPIPKGNPLASKTGLREDVRQRLGAAAEASVDAVMVMTPRRDENGEVVDFIFDFANSSAETYLGRTQVEIVGHGLVELSRTPTTLFVRDGLMRLLEQGESFRPEMVSEIEGVPGKWVQYQAQVVGDSLVATVRDIDDSKRLQLAAEEREARLNAVERLGRIGSYELDPGSGLSLWSPGLHELLEIPNSGTAAPHERFSELIHPEDLAAWTKRYSECGDNSEPSNEPIRIKTGSGQVISIHHVGEFIVDTEGRPSRSIGILRDVTQERLCREQLDERLRVLLDAQVESEMRLRELLRANEALTEVARTDGLTGLNNRRAFIERLRAEVMVSSRHDLPLTLILIDIDCFKELNDAHGHPAGDETLFQFGAILQDTIRQSDFVARYGGEEFVVLLPSTDLAGGMVLAEKIRAAVESAPFSYGRVTASFGCAQLASASEDASALLSEADQALYLAKSEGRNRVCSVSSDRTGLTSETLA